MWLSFSSGVRAGKTEQIGLLLWSDKGLHLVMRNMIFCGLRARFLLLREARYKACKVGLSCNGVVSTLRVVLNKKRKADRVQRSKERYLVIRDDYSLGLRFVSVVFQIYRVKILDVSRS